MKFCRSAVVQGLVSQAMQGLNVDLHLALERDEPHYRPRRSPGDRFGVVIAILLRRNVRPLADASHASL